MSLEMKTMSLIPGWTITFILYDMAEKNLGTILFHTQEDHSFMYCHLSEVNIDTQKKCNI